MTDNDLEMLKEEIANDPVHGKDPAFNAGVFVDPVGKSLVFEDNLGPVMWVNMRKEIRFTIQFRNGIDPQRTRDIFNRYLPEFSSAFKAGGITAMMFTTTNRVLGYFLRRFGFKKSPDEYRKVV